MAEILSDHKGPLFLNQVQLLASDCVDALVRHDGEVHLEGLKYVAQECKEKLASRPDIHLPVNVGDKQVKELPWLDGR